MSNQSWQQTLAFAPVAGSALTASTTATSLLPPAARAVLPANFFNIGTLLRVKAMGVMSTIVTTPGTLTWNVTLGPITTPIIVFTSAALALNIVAQTTFTWLLDILLTCRAVGVGTASNLIGTGTFHSRALLGAPAVASEQGVSPALLPDTSPAVGTGFDSTLTQTVDLMAAWSLNNANTITLQQYTLESLN
jgi:hypothetical protein